MKIGGAEESVKEGKEPEVTTGVVPFPAATPSNNAGIANSLVVIVAGVVLLALYFGRGVIIPIVLAIFISSALSPLTTFLVRCRFPRALASALVLSVLVTGVAATAYSFRFEAQSVVERLPEAARKLRIAVNAARSDAGAGPFEKVQQAATEIERTAGAAVGTGSSPASSGVMRVQVQEPVFRPGDYLWSGSVGLLTLMGQGIILLFLVYFLLASGDLFKRKLVRIAGPTMSRKKLTVQILDEVSAQIGRFLLIQLLTSAIVAALTGLSLWWLGVADPAIWGLLAGALNSIPYFGALAVSGGLALVAFLQFGTLTKVIAVAGVAFLITSLEGMLLTPILMGRAARINQVALFVGLLFWGAMWGVVGIILAVPIMMAVKTISDRVEGLSRVADLLGEKYDPQNV